MRRRQESCLLSGYDSYLPIIACIHHTSVKKNIKHPLDGRISDTWWTSSWLTGTRPHLVKKNSEPEFFLIYPAVKQIILLLPMKLLYCWKPYEGRINQKMSMNFSFWLHSAFKKNTMAFKKYYDFKCKRTHNSVTLKIRVKPLN